MAMSNQQFGFQSLLVFILGEQLSICLGLDFPEPDSVGTFHNASLPIVIQVLILKELGLSSPVTAGHI